MSKASEHATREALELLDIIFTAIQLHTSAKQQKELYDDINKALETWQENRKAIKD